MLLNSDLLTEYRADASAIVTEAGKALEIESKRILKKPFDHNREELKKEAAKIVGNYMIEDCIVCHIGDLEPFKVLKKCPKDKLRHIIDGVNKGWALERLIDGTKAVASLLLVFGRPFEVMVSDFSFPHSICNPLHVRCIDEGTFIEYCAELVDLQNLRNDYAHSRILLLNNKHDRKAIEKATNRIIDAIAELHSLEFEFRPDNVKGESA